MDLGNETLEDLDGETLADLINQLCEPPERDEPSIMKAVRKENLDKITYLITSGESVNSKDSDGYTPLHLAAMKENLDIMKCLLTVPDIDINARNKFDETPCFTSSKFGNFKMTQLLVDSGADVNIPNEYFETPLHASVHFPNISQLLIENGADLDAVDSEGRSVLHKATLDNCLETVYILLYYNADANMKDNRGKTPFEIAMYLKNVVLIDTLCEYVNDLSTQKNILDMTIYYGHCIVEKLLNTGVKVDKVAFEKSLALQDPKIFKLLWKRLDPREAKQINFFNLGSLKGQVFHDFIDVVLEDSDDSVLAVIAESISSYNMKEFIGGFPEDNASIDQLTKLIFLLLQNGYQMSCHVIHIIFIRFGYCELFKLLMFIDYTTDWDVFATTSRLIFDIESTIESRVNEMVSVKDQWMAVIMFLKDANESARYWIYRPLDDLCSAEIDDYLAASIGYGGFFDYIKNRPRVPSLLQLARDKTREYIVKKSNLRTTSQYYTVINYLNISSVYKKILTFEKPIYTGYKCIDIQSLL
ncbi:uncharacterized protein isoform X1 [Leptinotarsa decemlineata]|uniref:uncharacterized protein isoform X1 n=1 Tax=Leptinotarsa decemlineata TaxID=7539 RepID=UPI003D304091